MAWFRTIAYAQVFCVLIVAGTAASSSFDVSRDVGESLTTVIVTGLNVDTACYLDTPKGEIIELRPENHSTDKVKNIETAVVSYCGANITNLTEEDEGEWTIFYIGYDGERISYTYHLTVGKADDKKFSPSNAKRNIREEVAAQWLKVTEIRTSTGSSVNIALSKREDSLQETYFIISNNDEIFPLDNQIIPGVTVQGGSDFVANRVTIGPMSDALLGRWTLCGETTQNRRCQPVDIVWSNVNNPSEQWNTTIANRRDIVANNLGVADVTVRGAGGLLSCHVITPSGDDITVNSDSTYPGITFKPEQEPFVCTVSLGPIQKLLVGDWSIYAQFISRTLGRSEVRMPFSVSVNEDSNQMLQVTEIRTRTGSSVNIALSKTEDSLQETFFIITNKDEVLPLDSRVIPGFTVHGGSDFVANRVTIGPMSDALLGRWTLCGETTQNKRCQPVDIIWSNDNNPSEQWNTTIANRRDIVANNLGVADVTVRGAGGLLSCHVITPSGDDITVNSDSTYPGITFKPEQEPFLCTVSLGPIQKLLVGDWSIYAQFISRTLGRSEVRMPFSVSVDEDSAQLLQVTEIRTRTGSSVNIALSKREDSLQETFSIITNKDEVLPLDNRVIPGVTVQGGSYFVANRVTIGPMSDALLGRWTLCGETTQNRRCQPVDIIWSNVNNPSEQWNTTIANRRDIVANNLGVADVTVRGAGGLLSCHVITPSGDDITVNSDSTYPGITFKPEQEPFLCTVSLGPIQKLLVGDWSIYAQFISRTLGRSEVRMPFSVSVDEDSAQLLQVTEIRTRTGSSVNIALSKREDSLQETFSIITNNDEVLLLDNRVLPGVTVQGGSDFVANRVTIGPMSDALLGRWTLCGETTQNRRCQPVDIIWSNVNNPSEQWNTTIVNRRDIVANNMDVADVTVRGAGGLLSCHVITPSGDDITVNSDSTYPGITFKPDQEPFLCTVSLGPIQKQLVGDWTIYAQFISRTLGRSEVRMLFSVTVNEDDHQLLQVTEIRTRTGSSVNIALSKREDSLQETFSIITNNADVLPLDNRVIPGVTVQGGSDFVANRVTIGPMSDALLGRWSLCGETTQNRRCQPVNIVWSNVNNPSEQWNTTIANRRDIVANNLGVADVTVRGAGGLLSCHVITPSGDDITVNSDSTYLGITFKPEQEPFLCTVSLGPIQKQLVGDWTIYAQFISRTLGRSEVRMPFSVSLNEHWEPTKIVLPRDRPVNIILGPERAVFCKLTSPRRKVVFEGHGRCILHLRRVTNEDAGIWIMNVALRGHIKMKTYKITAVVKGTRDKPTVTTTVTVDKPSVTVSCSVDVEHEVRSCVFRDPTGRSLAAEPGAAEDRYIYTGQGSTVSNGVTTHECGLRITSPDTSDLGLWRCAIETEQEVHYGFLSVLCPWSMQDPEIAAAVVSEPTLTSQRYEIIQEAGDSLAMSCSIQAPIKYCYFRAPNGRTYSVSPATSSEDFEYVGAGLDAGECGIRFNNLQPQETGHWPEGRWSCHVGLVNQTQQEQRANIQVEIQQPIVANQYTAQGRLMVGANTAQERPVDYCRYVRMDGVGFTSAALPDERYTSVEQRSRGQCGLVIENPTILELHPWTVAALVSGREIEVMDVTDHSMNERPNPAGGPNINFWIWGFGVLAAAILIAVAILFIPVKNRRNTFNRFDSWKTSFRYSLTKKPLPHDEIQKSAPAMSA